MGPTVLRQACRLGFKGCFPVAQAFAHPADAVGKPLPMEPDEEVEDEEEDTEVLEPSSWILNPLTLYSYQTYCCCPRTDRRCSWSEQRQTGDFCSIYCAACPVVPHASARTCHGMHRVAER